jgi:hypothetical protein
MRLEVLHEKLEKAKTVLRALLNKFHPQTTEASGVAIEKPSPFGFGTVQVNRPTTSPTESQLQKFFEEIDGADEIGNDLVKFWDADEW